MSLVRIRQPVLPVPQMVKWLARRRLKALDALVTGGDGLIEVPKPWWWQRCWYAIYNHTVAPVKGWRREARFYRQRARRGWADADVWSFDTYLAGVIAGGLGRLRQTNMSHLSTMTYAQWLDKLAELERAFQHYHDNLYEPGFDYDKSIEEMRKIMDVWGSLWD